MSTPGKQSSAPIRLSGGRRDGGTDDACVVPQFRGPDGRTCTQHGPEVFELLADPAAEDEEIGPQQIFDSAQVAVESGCPFMQVEPFDLESPQLYLSVFLQDSSFSKSVKRAFQWFSQCPQ